MLDILEDEIAVPGSDNVANPSRAFDWWYHARNLSYKRRFLSEDLDLPPGDENRGIDRELASLAAIQLLKSCLASHTDLDCPEVCIHTAHHGHPHTSAGKGIVTSIRHTRCGESPWVCGFEKPACCLEMGTCRPIPLWETGYDGPQSISSEKSLANDSDGRVTPSSTLDSVEPRKGGQQIRWLEHPEEIRQVFHRQWWRKSSTTANIKSAPKSESHPDGTSSLAPPEAPYSGEAKRESLDHISCPDFGRPRSECKSSAGTESPLQQQWQHAYARGESPFSRESIHKLRTLGSLSHRFRRSKSVSTVATGSVESLTQDAKERRRRSREAVIFSDPEVFSPHPIFSGFRPDLIAIAGVMIATGELDRLSFRANDIAKARAGNQSQTYSNSLVSSPSELPNTPVAMSGMASPSGLKLTKGAFPTFAPANSPASGSATPTTTGNLQGGSRRSSRMTRRGHLSEVSSPEILELSDSPSASDSNRSQKSALTPPSLSIKEDISSPGVHPTVVHTPVSPIMAPLSPVHAPGAHYFAPCDLGAVPASNIKLRDHSSCETLRIEQTQPESSSREVNDQPKTAPRSPRVGPNTPSFESPEFTLWNRALKLLHGPSPASLRGTPLLGAISWPAHEAGLEKSGFQLEPLSPVDCDVEHGVRLGADSRPTSPLEVLEPREGGSKDSARVIRDIGEVLNGKNSLLGV